MLNFHRHFRAMYKSRAFIEQKLLSMAANTGNQYYIFFLFQASSQRVTCLEADFLKIYGVNRKIDFLSCLRSKVLH